MYSIVVIVIKILKTIINIIIPNKSLRTEYRKKINIKLSPFALELFRKDIEKKYKDYWIFVPFWPWGDFLIACSLLKQFKAENGGKILIFYHNKNQLEFINSLSFADKILRMPRELYYSTCTKFMTEKNHNKYGLAKGKLFELSHHVFTEAENNKSQNFLELYAKMLDLKIVKIEQPNFSESTKIEAQKIYDNVSNGKKVIMLSPHANSFDEKEISSAYWIKLGHNLEARGNKVVFNTSKKIFNEFEQVYLPLSQQCYFATLCHLNISLRSGFTDLITIAGVERQVILYPESMRFITITKEHQIEEIIRIFNIDNHLSFEDNMFKVTSINNMFNKNHLELVIKYPKTDEIYSAI